MPSLFSRRLQLAKPGIFITGTDTGVGKTVASCAIAAALRRQPPDAGSRVGVLKPMATGCRREREGLVSEDAEALAHFSDCRLPLDVINPVRYAKPLAPAVAAEESGVPVDFDEIARSLEAIESASDFMLVEGVGGLLVPIDGRHPAVTVLDLAVELRYPVAVVCRSLLGTLNHTAMTVRLLRSAGCRIAGLIVNGYEPDVARHTDPSMAANRSWLEKMNRVPILATLPACPNHEVAPEKALLPGAILDAAALTYWPDILRSPSAGG